MFLSRLTPLTLFFGFAMAAPGLAFAADPSGQPPAAPSPAQGANGLDQFVEPPAPSQNEVLEMANQMAFSNAIAGAVPLRPDQIQEIISKMSDVQEAAAPALADPERPRGTMKVETVSLDPGASPPLIKVAAGYVTTVMVMDATGAPWEIKDLAFAGKFEAKVPRDTPYVFRILPLSRFQEGNVTLQLAGLATPLTFRLSASNDEVYYRYDVRVPAMGPNARPPRFASANSMVAGDATIMSVLDGYPPSGAKRLVVSGLDDRSGAWEVNGQVYLRTPHSLLSPAWSTSAASGDGTTVYAIPETPVLLLSDQGLMVRARISRPEGLIGGDDR